VVETIIDEAYEESSLFCKSLCEVTDIEGTSALDGANYITKKILRQSYYFIKRYEIRDLSRPHHQSQTCIIHEAIDHSDDKRAVVALKFMKNKDSYNNEVLIRSKGGFDSDCVINIITQYDSDCDDWFKRRIEREGFSSHPYLIVMPFGGRNMSEVVSSGELINQSEAGSNTSVIRTVITDVARCLQHIHSKGFVHGDVKPKNIIRRSANSFLFCTTEKILFSSTKISFFFLFTLINFLSFVKLMSLVKISFSFFEKSSFVTEISDEEKDRHLRSFIERNRDRLWKFDLKFIGKSPGKVYRELANDYHLIDKMKSYHHKENNIKLGSSEKVTKCLKDDHLKSIKPEIFDPFKISMKPTIDMQKNEKISRLFAPPVTSNFKRGYRHEPEFGNFSTYVHILKKNEPSALKR
jgi:hypothetical protein